MIQSYFNKKIKIIRHPHLSKNQNWNFVSKKMEIFNNKKNKTINSYEWLDRDFLENNVQNKFIGFLHNTITYPEEYPEKYKNQVLPIELLVKDDYFLSKLNDCLKIIVFTDQIKNFIIKETSFYEVESVTHPAPDFLFEKKWNGNFKNVIHIGQQLRKYHSFLDLTTFKNKIMLNPIECENDIIEMNRYSKGSSNVYYQYNLDLKNYLNFLCNSIVFLDFYDVAACNTIIECIVLGVPVLVKKLEGSVEYLGENYPFYFENLEEANKKIDDEDLILQTSKYLQNLNKQKFKINYFLSDFFIKVISKL
jgi:hypothetical protein